MTAPAPSMPAHWHCYRWAGGRRIYDDESARDAAPLSRVYRRPVEAIRRPRTGGPIVLPPRDRRRRPTPGEGADLRREVRHSFPTTNRIKSASLTESLSFAGEFLTLPAIHTGKAQLS